MARMRQRFNEKGRQRQSKQEQTANANTKYAKTCVDSKLLGGDRKYDEANALVLPSKKKKKDVARSGGSDSVKKLLSRKQRKRLEKIVERREKKSNRAELLEELQKHQLPVEQYAQLTPLLQVQTEGLKKLFSSSIKATDSPETGTDLKRKSTVKGSNKLKYRSWSGRFSQNDESNERDKDPMILGVDEGSSSSSEDEASDVEIPAVDSDEGSNEGDKPTESAPVEVPLSKKVQASVDIKPEPDVVVIDTPEKAGEINKRKQFVRVNRTPEIEAIRSKLPIIPEEQIIMEAVTENMVVVLAGETGSGKTTQVPQFLYEAGYSLNNRIIGVTEPRRVAAIAMSKRVGKELNLSTELVSYQIRFEGNSNPKTKIKFMTDGVLLKEIEKDFLLTKYSAICIDEAHERSLYTDLLIGLLSRCVKLREKRNDPLKLIIMSATMRVEDFQENLILFKSPPRLIHIPTRQFPVQVHFEKVTPQNYLLAAYRKAAQIHRKLPPGGILIFVTGQQEVRTLVSKLKRAFSHKFKQNLTSAKGEATSGFKKNRIKRKAKKAVQLKPFDLDKIRSVAERDEEEQYISDDSDGDAAFELDEDESELASEWDVDGSTNDNDEPLHILPLYSMLSSNEQQKVFEPPPSNCRLCVVCTNVAETSLTIPSIRYVIDTGKVKVKDWDKLTGVQQFRVSWCSKASAEQRSGRAGRTGPGHCYRLYSSAVFESDFEQYSPPEILLRPVDDMMLFMKSIGIDKVQNFPFPTHPGETQLVGAEETLVNLGALELVKAGTPARKKPLCELTSITDLGRTMALFPLNPRFSKMLALSFNQSVAVVEYTIALVAALTIQQVFVDVSLAESNKESRSAWTKLRRQWAGTGSKLLLGDCMLLLRAVGAFEYEGGSEKFCESAGLRAKAMNEIRKLRKQLTLEVNVLVEGNSQVSLDPQMKPPTDEAATVLRQILLSGLPDRIARKIKDDEIKDDEDKKKLKYAYRCGELEEPVIMHPSSVLRTLLPEWVVYQEIFESNQKMYMRGITGIEPAWIPAFCSSLCTSGAPLADPPPYFDTEKGIIKCFVKSTYGRQGWPLPVHEMEYPYSLDKFKLFSQFLLEGAVVSKLAEWKSSLLSMPVTMVKPWARLQPRTQTLLNELTARKVCSRDGLLKEWERDKNYLLEVYLAWVPSQLHVQVSCSWPPVSTV